MISSVHSIRFGLGYYFPTGTDIWIPSTSFFFFFFNVVEAELIYCLFERAAHTNHLTFESHTEASPHDENS